MQEEDGGAASQSHDSSVSVAGSAGNLPKWAISLCPDLSLFLILFASVLPSHPCVAACAQAACMLSLPFRAESTCSDCVVFAVASTVTNHVPLVLLLLQGLWLQAQVG